MIQRKTISDKLQELCSLFKHSLVETDIKAYFLIINDRNWTQWEWETAVDKCKAECTYFPRPAEILERWEKDPAKIVEPEFVPMEHSREDDAEIEDMIKRKIKCPKLQEKCRNIVFRKPATGQAFERKINCQICEDRGSVEIYHPHTCHKAKAGTLEPFEIRTCMISCVCPSAPIGRTYDKLRMPRVRAIGPIEAVEEVTSFYGKSTHNDFDDWAPTSGVAR